MRQTLARIMHRLAPWQRPEGWTTVRSGNPGQFEYKGQTARVAGWERNGVVQACVRAVAELYASVPLEAVTVNGEGEAKALPLTHPASKLLARPGVNLPLFRLQEHLAVHYLLYGNALWTLKRQGRRGLPIGVKMVHPEWISWVHLDEDDEPALWKFTDRSGRVLEAPYTDVVHFADINADDWLFGYPRAAAALLDMMVDNEASQYVREVVTNDGAATLIFTLHPDVSMDDAEAMQQRWQEKRTARGMRGAAAFVPGTMDAKQIGWNLSQLEFPDLRRVSRETICAVFGVDPRMVGVGTATSDGGLSGVQYKEARRRLLLQTVAPMMAAVESQLNLWLAPEFGNQVRFRHNPDAFAEIAEDMQETSTRVLAELAGGARTLEETREALGLPPDRDASHTVLLKAGVLEVPVSAATLTPEEIATSRAPQPAALPPGDASDGPDAEDEASGEERTAAASLDRVYSAGMLPAPDAPTAATREDAAPAPDARRLAIYTRNDTSARRQEPAYIAAARLQFDADARAVQDILLAGERAGPEPAPDWDAIIANLEAYFTSTAATAWAERFLPLLKGTMQEAARDLAADLNVAFNINSPYITAAWDARAARLARYVCEHTADLVVELVRAGAADQLGVRGVARLINQVVFDGQAPARARVIAQTETLGALNTGQYAAALDNAEIIDVKEWMNLGDEKVRDSHVAVAGKRIALTAPFTEGLAAPMLHPGDPNGPASEVINCRCSVLYDISNEGEQFAGPRPATRVGAHDNPPVNVHVTMPPVHVTVERKVVAPKRVRVVRDASGRVTGAEVEAHPMPEDTD